MKIKGNKMEGLSLKKKDGSSLNNTHQGKTRERDKRENKDPHIIQLVEELVFVCCESNSKSYLL